jgi:predicted ATPase
MSHDDQVRVLGKRFKNNTFENFGPILMTMHIQGFRGISNLELEFKSPITALSGMNGTGKSTIVQLAACSYRRPEDHNAPRRHYVKNFFPVSVADPQPFAENAMVQYSYAMQGGDRQHLTVSRAKKEWSGYKRQPARSAFYLGFTYFIPKIEKRDLSINQAQNLELGESRLLDSVSAEHIGRILSLDYWGLGFTGVYSGDRFTELAVAMRSESSYSENHMGFGEGRVVYTVNTLEAAPEKSLFLLEEPETALHGDAQVRLARYLVDVVKRRGHQIILTTHSAAILGQLGRDSVVYLRRSGNGEVTATHGLSTYQIDSHLQKQGRSTENVSICVEDAFAQCLAQEILRMVDADLLEGCKFLQIGGAQEIPNAVKILNEAGRRTIGLLDGDMKEDKEKGIITLPGDGPPEKEVFAHEAVRKFFAEALYDVDVNEILSGVEDHHDYVKVISSKIYLAEDAVVSIACHTYVSAHEKEDFSNIAKFVRSRLGDRR